MSILRRPLNRHLDHVLHPEAVVLGRRWPAFQVWGGVGLALAVPLALALVVHRGLSPWVMVGIVLAALGVLWGLTMLTKLVTGQEQLVNYHHQVAVLLMTAGVAWSLGQPVLAYLDATMLGVGLFIACGRIGCLMAGCCHGRPHAWGVCYREAHAAAGFEPDYVGVRLFPVQVVEAVWVFGVVLVGSLLVWVGRPPGEALVWYLCGYATGRFYWEFLRGDAGRLEVAGLSEAQWTSLALLGLTAAGGAAGLLPFHVAVLLPALGVLLSMLAMAAARRADHLERQLLHPKHVREIAAALKRARRSASGLEDTRAFRVERTSLGLQLSAGRYRTEAEAVDCYTFSHATRILPARTTRRLADLILRLAPGSGTGEIISRSPGTFHLVVSSSSVEGRL